mmetsp:Transcript_38095/g.77055  ORF Transcript_38095/g.77055 Transcript_38095/m.77055 type:complete len:80 (-) Transcript_38095:49-288(-)
MDDDLEILMLKTKMAAGVEDEDEAGPGETINHPGFPPCLSQSRMRGYFLEAMLARSRGLKEEEEKEAGAGGAAGACGVA